IAIGRFRIYPQCDKGRIVLDTKKSYAQRIPRIRRLKPVDLAWTETVGGTNRQSVFLPGRPFHLQKQCALTSFRFGPDRQPFTVSIRSEEARESSTRRRLFP